MDLLLPPLNPKGFLPFILRKHLSVQLRRCSQLSLSIFPIFSSTPKGYMSSTLSRSSSHKTQVFCSPLPQNSPKGPKEQTQNYFRSATFGTYSLQPRCPAKQLAFPRPRIQPSPSLQKRQNRPVDWNTQAKRHLYHR